MHVRRAVFVGFAACFFLFFSLSPRGNEWDERPFFTDLEDPLEGTIPIPTLRADQVDEFYALFWEKQPVIIRGATRHSNVAFRKLVSKEELLEHYPGVLLTLSTANTNSYDKAYETLEEYVRHRMGPQNVSKSGIETLYLFGDNAQELEASLLPQYELPAPFMKRVSRHALSFGISGAGTGVPMHTHGAVFAEVLYGRKRWFLSAPDDKPRFNGSETMLHWYRHRVAEQEPQRIFDGVCGRGDLIYLPSHFYHATLNIGQTVFMSVFVDAA